MTPLIYHMGTS